MQISDQTLLLVFDLLMARSVLGMCLRRDFDMGGLRDELTPWNGQPVVLSVGGQETSGECDL